MLKCSFHRKILKIININEPMISTFLIRQQSIALCPQKHYLQWYPKAVSASMFQPPVLTFTIRLTPFNDQPNLNFQLCWSAIGKQSWQRSMYATIWTCMMSMIYILCPFDWLNVPRLSIVWSESATVEIILLRSCMKSGVALWISVRDLCCQVEDCSCWLIAAMSNLECTWYSCCDCSSCDNGILLKGIIRKAI